MKKLYIFLMCIFCLSTNAQESESEPRSSNPQLFIGNAAVNYNSELQIQMQVGNPLIPLIYTTDNKDTYTFGFPYAVNYLSDTFATTGIVFSKGYYTDKVNIKWRIGANEDRITNIVIYRKELGTAGADELIGTLSSAIFEFDDTEIQGGVLYEYRIVAEGVSSDGQFLEFRDFIQGVGFRSPTATVSGSVSFEGGSPVEEVIVFAEANGAENNASSSLYFNGGNGNVTIEKKAVGDPNKDLNILTDALTLQSWVSVSGSGSGSVFKVLTTENKTIELNITKSTAGSSFLKFKATVDNDVIGEVVLSGSYPTGEIDNFGKDVFEAIDSLKVTSFMHVSLALKKGTLPTFYINGRILNEDITKDISDENSVTTPDFTLVSNKNYDVGENDKINKILLGKSYVGYIDEVRVWERILSVEEIRRDYRRYISGAENKLSVYLRMDENAGKNVYDISKEGFTFNKNNGYLKTDVSFSSNTPENKQLGVFGVTDKNGSYIISAISYSGTGESFVVTPSFGVHKFEPASQTLFLGNEESVVNQLNFKDVSSFEFNGKVVYNTQGVFKSEEETGYSDIKDYGYNQYKAKNSGSSVTINKGKYYYEGGGTNTAGFHVGGKLKEYFVIAVDKAYIYIDGTIVIGPNNQPVQTDSEGKFTINVPIGNHKVEVRKDGHTFEHSGYFPASGTSEFFEDQIEATWFIDKTRISLIGKVVGGKIESDKPIGFGLEGAFTYVNFEGETTQESETISSKNNIGVAEIILKGDPNSSDFDVAVKTNSVTGEYKVSLIPYIYKIQPSDLKVPANGELNGKFLTSIESLNLLATPVLDSISYTTKDGTELFSEAFHHQKSFRYNSPVTLALLEQQFEKEITIGDVTFDISGLDNPIYIQKKKYDITFEVSQNYVNQDVSNNIITTKEYFTEGKLDITNNLEIAGKSTTVISNNGEAYKYSFYAGEANTTKTEDFAKGMSVKYNIEGINSLGISNPNDFKDKGVIKGGVAAGGVTFATYAPETPDIILRDPPGSNSFASIERGTTITYSEEKTSTSVNEDGGGFYLSVGPNFEISTGFGVLIGLETTIVADVEGTFNKSVENTAQNVTTNSYTFNQTISTSDDPNFVGADGDLYIGNSRNMYYGIFDNIFITSAPLYFTSGAEIDHITVKAKTTNANGSESEKDLFITAREQRIIIDQPTKTFFTYSQKYLVEVLIPEFTTLANNFVADSDKPLMTAESYREQADLWRKIIQENERSKYEAKNNKDAYKQAVLDKIQGFGNFQDEMTALVSDNFFSNQSFDAGVGEFTSAISSVKVIGNSVELNIETSAEYKEQLGVLINNVGLVGNLTQTDTTVDTENYNSESEITNTISYTLKDNDQNNVLSVDVLNMFDGNGPIFVTKAGSTSCPYEPETTSLFYKKTGYDKDLVGEGGEILSAPTNRVYLPKVTTLDNSLVNIPESEGALFNLELKNSSETNSDLEYIIEVDALTLKGATTNIAANGVNIYLPYDKTVPFPFEVYKSSASSNYKYDNIRVYLKSPCADINDSSGFIDVSVEFKKSCSKVAISAPQDNWVFNRAAGYATVTIDDITTITENTLPITFTDFSTDFAGFEKIELEYRNTSSQGWEKFKTYYGSEALRVAAGDDNGVVIGQDDFEFTFDWDVIGDDISDGNYELRAISYCSGTVTNVSPIIQGVVNLNAPVLFGTPQPTDGILDVGEDISLRFNEDVYMNGDATNFVEIRGLENQQEIDHSVSVYLDGSANQIELPNQILPKGSFTIQFWYENATEVTGNLISQENGINASLNGDELTFSVGGASVTATIDSSQYNFYSLVYQSGAEPQLLIFENGNGLQVNGDTDLPGDLDFNSNSSIFIGGSNVKGTIHDLRFWSKPFTPAQANVAKDKTLTGRELNLLGYWPLDEGHGKVGIDKAKSRNATVNLGWAIKPKGTGYTFADDDYLELGKISDNDDPPLRFVQPSVAEDITLSFWIKIATASAGTIFSNGKGNNEDHGQTNGFRNKWSVNMKSDGNLELLSENMSYDLTTQSIADGSWHHVALVVKRGGSINTYVDALETSSVSSVNIGGISGNKILVGARLYEDASNNETIDNHFTGSLDEIRLWNTARSFEQIKRDRYFEIDAFSAGLMLYIDFNQEDSNTDKGPIYSHLAVNNTVTSTFSILGGTTAQSYTRDSPALKPKLKLTNITFTTVINGDQMIIQPTLTTEQWSLFEGQILDFSVSDMKDEHYNKQISPITWSAFVNRQEIEWFTTNQTKEIVAEKNVNETYSFTMDVVNKGGSNQGYTISGLPTWITVQNSSGSVAPNATKQVNFIVDAELSMGTYNADIYLETASEFNDRLTLSLRVLTTAPDWSVNAPDYSNSMNVIGKIKINEVFSRDKYTKIGAFVDDNPRGEGYLIYDTAYDSYFVYLTAYSNVTSGEEITFKIWDAINGKVLIAAIDGAPNTSFLQNEVLGSKSTPVLFSGAEFSEQTLALNKGWTWTSFYVEDGRFDDIGETFAELALQTGDQIKSQNEFTNYENNDWFGSLTAIANNRMYKVNLAAANALVLIGNDVDEANVNLYINKGWNWLPFPIHRNISIEEALSFYQPSDGDVIKDQYTFAIYDASSGWSGTLNYMQSNRGYMMKSGASQTLNYPNSENAAKSDSSGQEHAAETIALFSKYNANMSIVAEVIADENYSEVLVYDVEDNLRGVAPIVTLNNKKVSFISVFSNVNDVLKFKLSDGITAVDITSGFVFENNKVLGTLKNPVILSLESLSTDDLFLNNIVLYPNPFSNKLTVSSVNQIEKVTKIEVYSTLGALITKVVVKTDETIIDTASFAKGIYLIKLTSDSGHMIIKKMVKQ
jgi:hypothetical protein